MSDGLKRAFAVTARTRSDASLTPEMRKFLNALAYFACPVQPQRLAVNAGGPQCAARRKCRDLGYADRVLCEDGRRRWQITLLGRKMISSTSPLAEER